VKDKSAKYIGRGGHGLIQPQLLNNSEIYISMSSQLTANFMHSVHLLCHKKNKKPSAAGAWVQIPLESLRRYPDPLSKLGEWQAPSLAPFALKMDEPPQYFLQNRRLRLTSIIITLNAVGIYHYFYALCYYK